MSNTTDSLRRSLDRLYRNTSHPDVPAIVSAYQALRQLLPEAGHPLCQLEYDRFFRYFKRVYDATPQGTEEWERLSEVKSDYTRLLADHLSRRSDDTFRSDSYFWLSVAGDTDYESPYFPDILAEDAERRLFSNYALVKSCHNAPGCCIPDIECTWLLNVLIAMLLNPRHRYVMAEECIAIAKEDLDALRHTEDPEGHAAQLQALLHLRTGDPTLRNLADAAIAAWSNNTQTPEQKYFLAYYRSFPKFCPQNSLSVISVISV